MRRLRIALLSAVILVPFLASPAASQADLEAQSWASIMGSDNIEDVRNFLQAFPKGEFANEARRKYSVLTHDKLPPSVRLLELRYPATARGVAFRARRYVILDVIVNPEGKTQKVTYTRKRGVDAMDYAANGAARRATYLPAMDNGVAVQEHMSLTVEFHQECSRAALGVIECMNFNNARGLGRP